MARSLLKLMYSSRSRGVAHEIPPFGGLPIHIDHGNSTSDDFGKSINKSTRVVMLSKPCYQALVAHRRAASSIPFGEMK